MLTLQGKNGQANVYTDLIDDNTIGQVINMLNQPITENARLAIMPDVHLGSGATIGTTIQLYNEQHSWKVSPNVVGVDIGCSMYNYKLNVKVGDIDLAMLDRVVHEQVPVGFDIHTKDPNRKLTRKLINDLTFKVKNEERIHKSLGTLGGGNHFIEVAQDEEGFLWLTVHSGSRSLGLLVANHHQKKAEFAMYDTSKQQKELIAQLVAQGRQQEIETELQKLKQTQVAVNGTDKHLAYLTGDLLADYLHDMELTQEYSHYNREYMLNNIVKELPVSVLDQFESMHNFVDTKAGIIRKGATSANKGERLIIPLNMRDGSLICVGKGNSDWNCSAPHGAGRILSRSQATAQLSYQDYQDSMKGIYTSSLNRSNIDESPMAYKPMNAIVDNIGDTVDIIHHLKPVYNRKA